MLLTLVLLSLLPVREGDALAGRRSGGRELRQLDDVKADVPDGRADTTVDLPAPSFVTELRIGSVGELQAQLDAVETMDGSVSLVVEPDVLHAPELREVQRRPNVHVFVRSPDGRQLPTYFLSPEVNGERVIEYSPSLLVKFPEGARVLPDVQALERRPFSRESTRVAALFDRADKSNQSTLADLKRATRNNLDVIDTPKIEPLFEKARGKLLMLVGHVEEGRFIVDSVDGRVLATFDIRELAGLAEKYDVALFSLGCETGHIEGVTGYRDEINSLVLASQLGHALGASTQAEFFERLGSPSQPFVVNHLTLDKTRVLIEGYLSVRSGSVTVWPRRGTSDLEDVSRPPVPHTLRSRFRRFLINFLLILGLLYLGLLRLAPSPLRFLAGTVYWIFALPLRLVRAGWRALHR